MFFETIFSLIGGLGLFIYGMQQLGQGLQRIAGDRLKEFMGSLTNNRIKGISVGAVITSILQSSSVTTTILVGFVNAGILNLSQSVGVIMGCNIGTTVTAQLLAFKVDKLALPAIGIGFAINFLGKRSRTKNIGLALLGFGLLFLGLETMKHSVMFLRDSQWTREVFISAGSHPLYGVLIGIVVTVAVQSSTASIGLLLSLAAGGLISIAAAIPILLGTNIGTCVTALLASIGANVPAKRAAVVHVLFNVVGAVIILVTLPIYEGFITLTSADILRQIANAHTIFNVLITIILYPAIDYMIKVVIKIIPNGEEEIEISYLEERFLETPVLAFEQVKKETQYMVKNVVEMFDLSFNMLMEKKIDLQSKVLKKESTVDLLQKDITDYLVRLAKVSLTSQQSQEYSEYMHIVGDLERIGDHSENISRLGVKIIDSKQSFSPEALREITELQTAARVFLEKTSNHLSRKSLMNDSEANAHEENIDRLVHEMKKRHISRLNNGVCQVYSGIIFMDLLHNYEKIGDHCLNIYQQLSLE